MTLVNDSKLASSLIASCLIHAIVVVLASTLFMKDSNRRDQNLIPIGFVDLPSVKQETPRQEEEKPNVVKKPPLRSPKPKVERLERAEPVAKKAPVEQPLPPQLTSSPKEEAVKSPGSHTTLPAGLTPHYSTASAEGGGSEAGAGNFFGKGDVGVVSGTDTAGGGGSTAAFGSWRASGTPGLAAPTTPFRTDREAKPVQTVRASYPPMALRIGLEGDVTLRIAVDSEGNVTDAEIVKSGGAGFDEEALKAVKQARFEPAQNEGRNVPAEFTYVYRFRLRK